MFHFRHRNGFGNALNGVHSAKHACCCGFDLVKTAETLAEVEPGQQVYICCLSGERRLVRRLSEMGFIPGTHVKVIRRAPLQDPIEFEIRGYLVSLRREEAECIRVKAEQHATLPLTSEPVLVR